MVDLHDLDDLATRAVADPIADPRPTADLSHRARRRRQRRVLTGGGVTVLLLVAATAVGLRALDDGSADDVVTAGPNADDGRGPLGLNELFDRPATPEDEVPSDFFIDWDWDGHVQDLSLDFEASRAVPLANDVPAYAVPTDDRTGVCFVVAVEPPDWYPDIDSSQPVACAHDPAEFTSRGLTQRVCGPDEQWYTAALVTQRLDPDDIAPYGTLLPSGAVILYEGTGPDDPVEVEDESGETVTLQGLPIGHQPSDQYGDVESSC